MGYYSWNERFGSHAFSQSATLKDLSHKNTKTVNFAKQNTLIHYQSHYQERPYKQDQEGILLLQ